MCQSCYYLTCSVSIAVHFMSSKLQIEKQLLFSLIGCRYKYPLMRFDIKYIRNYYTCFNTAKERVNIVDG